MTETSSELASFEMVQPSVHEPDGGNGDVVEEKLPDNVKLEQTEEDAEINEHRKSTSKGTKFTRLKNLPTLLLGQRIKINESRRN